MSDTIGGEAPASSPSRRGASAILLARLAGSGELSRIGLLVLLVVAAGLLSPTFLKTGNLQTVLLAVSVVGVAAIGMTLVLIAGEIDLSVASAAAFATVVGGQLVPTGSSALVILATLATGAAIGLVNGVAVAVFRVPSLIATLAMLSIARALCNIVSGGQAVYPDALDGYMAIGRGSLLGVPTPIAILVGTALLGIVLTRLTVFGRKLYAVGGNAAAAALSGIAVPRVKIAIFLVSGVCAAIAGMIGSARLAYIDPAGFGGVELEAIAIAVLGGASLFGGRGSIEGALIAVLILGVVNSVLNQMGVSIYLQQVIVALIIVAVVLPDGFRRVRA